MAPNGEFYGMVALGLATFANVGTEAAGMARMPAGASAAMDHNAWQPAFVGGVRSFNAHGRGPLAAACGGRKVGFCLGRALPLGISGLGGKMGRASTAASAAGGALGLWAVLAGSPAGELDTFDEVRLLPTPRFVRARAVLRPPFHLLRPLSKIRFASACQDDFEEEVLGDIIDEEEEEEENQMTLGHGEKELDPRAIFMPAGMSGALCADADRLSMHHPVYLEHLLL